MVSLDEIRSSNARIATALPAGLVAVFLGGTGAVGGTSLRQFAKHTVKPRIYFLGRSQESGDRIVAELKELNPDGEYIFLSADVSLLGAADDVCGDIKSRENHINLLFMTTGTLGTGEATAEGLDYGAAVSYYSRVRFIVNLLPLLQRAPSLRRVVTVLAGTKEGEINFDDFSGASLPMTQLRGHLGSMTTLALESIALEAPDVSFVHSFPGSVKTNLGSDIKSAPMMVFRALYKVLGPFINIPYAEAGERQLFIATSARYPPKLGAGSTAGVPTTSGTTSSAGSNGELGSGVYSVNYDGESAPPKVGELLMRLRADDVVRKLWLHTEEVFTRITGSTFVV
ncbi:hypothetical protein QBC34DRAFT_441211 [Podospora aff. communis PSN243]|uniref:Short-chain dehydrogenases/reductase n=1 Tax=Podospora aff. communis PSN243 TaxID=3040156 RepID=A0AAV9GD20_9PEZI|nr:hypothetical protein QBC34DRAFT_441211 [Podospora aff. communis PSN243]